MKKKLSVILLLACLCSIAFAAPKKADPYKHDFVKDFYPGVGYVVTKSTAFKDAYFAKADILKDEYIIEKVTGLVAINPVWCTLKLSVQKDGTISYEFSDLVYKKDKTKTEVTPLFVSSAITSEFDKLLPAVFSDDSLYESSKEKFYNNAGMLYAMSNGLTDIRMEKFSTKIYDSPINLEAKVSDAKLNSDSDYPDFKYRIVCYSTISLLTSVNYVYYTNDDDKAEIESGDVIKISGKIKTFKKTNIGDYRYFYITDEE